MGKSKSKSNSRSISKLKRLFSSAPKASESKEDLGSQPVSPAPSNNSCTSNPPKSKPKRKSTGTREDGTGPLDDHGKSPAEEKKPGDPPSKPEKKKEAKKEEPEASVFEEVQGPAAPVRTGTHGIKNKMRWKIDVEGADCLGDQKMPEVLDKMTKLRKKMKTKKCKVLKANENKQPTEDEDEKEVNKNEELIMNSARVLQLIKLEAMITKEIAEPDQEVLRAYCRSGDQEDKAEQLIEKLVLGILSAVVTKNEFIRQVMIPGELRMFAVDEKKAKIPMMALLMARKDLLYVSWSKPNRDVENMLDGTWAGMTFKKGNPGVVRSARLGQH